MGVKHPLTIRQLYTIFIFISLFTGVIFSLFMIPKIQPYNMHPTHLKRNIPNATLVFHDFDNDI